MRVANNMIQLKRIQIKIWFKIQNTIEESHSVTTVQCGDDVNSFGGVALVVIAKLLKHAL